MPSPALDALRAVIPAYAKDIGINLGVLADETVLEIQPKWGSFVAVAHAAGQPALIRAVDAAAREAGLSAEALDAAKAAASIMAMNNVYYRALHLMQNQEYRALPSRLRMNVISNPGVAKVDFELWCTAVSAVNSCGVCLDAHEEELRRRGVPVLQIQAALRIAAVVNAAGRVLAAEAA
ncbi:MAG: carboxymuconolactone decarboxylase family protein [Caulobacter sp.]